MSGPQTSQTITVGGHRRMAPDGWVFVTNDPTASKHPDRMFALLNETQKIVVIGDASTESFEVVDIRERSKMTGQRVITDPVAPWRVGRTPFRDIGEIGRALSAVLSQAA